MIDQNIGLAVLAPIAIEKLRENILAEGDLLKSILTSDKNFRDKHLNLKQQVITIFEDKTSYLKIAENRHRQVFKAFDIF